MIKIITVSIAVCLCFLIFKQENDLARHRTLRDILVEENRIMHDQINDMQFAISSSRTYEEGVTDGVNKAKNADWIDGYHKGISQNASPLYSSTTKE